MKTELLGLGRALLLGTLALGIVLGPAASSAHACNVPVFRYALEHWRPDAYRAVLYHRGPLSPDEQARLDDLQARADKALVNLLLRTVDLDAAIESADQDLFKSLGNVPLPRLVIQYPAHLKIERPLWSGPFGEQNLTELLNSPLRQEILKRLTGGQTAVWLMIDSGDAGQDDRAAAALESELERLHRSLKLPELTDSPEDVIQDGPPLRVEFSLLRIQRDDPAEQALVSMLMNCEPDLPTLEEPLVFPLFGRSRCMLPLVGAGISQDNIQSSARFLAGACSCQVKELNPGFDLLLTADWNELLSWAKSPAFASGESPESATAEPEFVPIPGGVRSAQAPAADAMASVTPTAVLAPVATTTVATEKDSSPKRSIPQASQSILFLLAGLMLMLVVGSIRAGRRR
jgi:hypothetical protein